MRRHCIIGILLAALTCVGSAQLSAQGSAPGPWQPFLIPDGKSVYDIVNHVTWLTDMNLPHKEKFRFGFALCDGSITEPQPCIWADGSMNYTSAQAWVLALNAYVDPISGIVTGYLGHTTWQLPTAPRNASDCSGTGPAPYSESFAFGCDTNALGFLYHTALGFRAPNTAVPIPPIWWAHSAISNLISIGPVRAVVARARFATAALPILVSPPGPKAAAAEVITRMFCQ